MTRTKQLAFAALAAAGIVSLGGHTLVAHAATPTTKHKMTSETLSLSVTEISPSNAAFEGTQNGQTVYVILGKKYATEHALPAVGDTVSVTGYERTIGGFSDGPIIIRPTSLTYDGNTITIPKPEHMGGIHTPKPTPNS
jgi:hypothetical protein